MTTDARITDTPAAEPPLWQRMTADRWGEGRAGAVIGWAVLAVAVALVSYQVYTAVSLSLTTYLQRVLHLMFVLVLVFMVKPAGKGRWARSRPMAVVDLLLILAAVTVSLYPVLQYDAIVSRTGLPSDLDLTMGAIAIALLVEACRRMIGTFMAVLVCCFLVYAWIGPLLPGLLSHRGYTFQRIIYHNYLFQEGIYGIPLGSKDNFEVDRKFAALGYKLYPEGVDIARQNRQFLYRAVRYLAEDQGIDQFLDLGSGLPTDQNVHQVAQRFRPGARVVYVDNDPIVLVHGRALLAEDSSTIVVEADITDPAQILDSVEVQQHLDFTRPIGVLLLSIPHNIPDDEAAHRAVRGCLDHCVPGSHLVLSHLVSEDPAIRADLDYGFGQAGMPFKCRSPHEVEAMVKGLEPVEPGLGDVVDWRPDPDQPPLPEPHPVAQPYVGASATQKRGFEYGGVLRKD
jgi:SAM-dependent methyltransferase